MNTKGDASSLVIIVAVMFILGIVALSAGLFWKEIKSGVEQTPEFNESAKYQETVSTIDSIAIPMLDIFVVVVFIGFLIFLIVVSSVINAHPVLALAFFLVTLVCIFLAGQLANAYFEISTDAVFVSVASQMPLTQFILGRAYPTLIGIAGFITMIILYYKGKGGTAT